MIYDIKATTLTGEEKPFDDYKGEVLLIVNTASKCGFTPQYEGLQKLHEQYKDQGLKVLGFPCNQFGHQEPGTEKEIAENCLVNYGVDFQMFSKVDVNGNDAHPLFQFLKSQKGGFLSNRIKWNFTKFLVDRNGKVVERFKSTTPPSKIAPYIEQYINA